MMSARAGSGPAAVTAKARAAVLSQRMGSVLIVCGHICCIQTPDPCRPISARCLACNDLYPAGPPLPPGGLFLCACPYRKTGSLFRGMLYFTNSDKRGKVGLTPTSVFRAPMDQPDPFWL